MSYSLETRVSEKPVRSPTDADSSLRAAIDDRLPIATEPRLVSDPVSSIPPEPVRLRSRSTTEVEATPIEPALNVGLRPTSLERLIEEGAGVAVREFVRAQFPHPDPRSPFKEIFEEMKELAFTIAAKDPYRHLTENEYERRLAEGARSLVSPGKLRDSSDRVERLALLAVCDIVAASAGRGVQIPVEWRCAPGARGNVVVSGGNRLGFGGDEISFGEEEPPEIGFELVPRIGNPASADEADRRIACIRETRPVYAPTGDDFTVVGSGTVDGKVLDDFTPYEGSGFDDGDTDEDVVHPFTTLAMEPDREVPFEFRFQPFEKDRLDSADVQQALNLAARAAVMGATLLSDNNRRVPLGLMAPTPDGFREALLILDILLKSADAFNAAYEFIVGGIADLINTALGITNDLFTKYWMSGSYVYERKQQVLLLGALRRSRSELSGLSGNRTVFYRYSLKRQATDPGRDPIPLSLREQFGTGTQSDDIRVFELPQGERGLYTLDPALTLRPRSV